MDRWRKGIMPHNKREGRPENGALLGPEQQNRERLRVYGDEATHDTESFRATACLPGMIWMQNLA